MVNLFCIIVGVAGNAFEVNIDDGASVGHLKEAIKEKNKIKLKDVDAGDLQLFLAKKDGGGWLDEAGAAAVVSDDLQRFTPMDSTLFVKNRKNFGPNFQSDVGQVHVLVVIPPEESPRKKQRVGNVEVMHASIDEQDELDAICELGQRLTREDLVTRALLKIPRKVLRVNLPRGLYVRQEYLDMHAIMTTDLKPGDRVLVIGSPGIGKSVFGVFLLVLFMSERKNVAFRPLGEEAKIYYFTWNGIENRYKSTLQPISGNEYEGLFDGKEYGAEWAVTLTFVHSYLFASPRRENYNEFDKEECARVYMNPWTKDECQDYADAVGLEDDEWFTRYSLVGGKPRLLFSSRLTMDDLDKKVSDAIPAEFSILEGMLTNVEGDSMRNTLFEMYRDVKRPSLCFLQYASDFIANIVSATFHGEKNDRIRKLLDTSDSNLQAWRGRVCERFLLRDAAIRKICVRPLEEETEGIIRSLGPYNAESTTIKAASDICAKKMVYHPLSKNFPAVDAVLVVPDTKRVIYLQATVGSRHPILHQRFKDIIKVLKDSRKFAGYRHILLFLVRDDTYDQFTRQSYKNKNKELSDSLGVKVTQYVGKIIDAVGQE